jgi:hypothetical protein
MRLGDAAAAQTSVALETFGDVIEGVLPSVGGASDGGAASFRKLWAARPLPIALGAGVQISQPSGECAEAVLG